MTLKNKLVYRWVKIKALLGFIMGKLAGRPITYRQVFSHVVTLYGINYFIHLLREVDLSVHMEWVNILYRMTHCQHTFSLYYPILRNTEGYRFILDQSKENPRMHPLYKPDHWIYSRIRAMEAVLQIPKKYQLSYPA